MIVSEAEQSDRLPGVINELVNLVQVFRDERAQLGKAMETALESHGESLREVVRQELAAATASLQQSSAQGQRVLEGAADQLREEAFGLRTVRLWFHGKLVGSVVLAVVLGLMGLNAYVYTTFKADVEAMRHEARLSRASIPISPILSTPRSARHSGRNSTRSIPACTFCPLTRAADARIQRRPADTEGDPATGDRATHDRSDQLRDEGFSLPVSPRGGVHARCVRSMAAMSVPTISRKEHT